MQMDAGLDTGDMLLTETIPIAATDTTATLHDRLAVLGGRMLVDALAQVAAGTLRPVPQPAQGITYAHKIDKAESGIDWSLPATMIGHGGLRRRHGAAPDRVAAAGWQALARR